MNEPITIPQYLVSRLESFSEKLVMSNREALEALFDWAEISLSLVEILELQDYKTNLLYDKVEELNKRSDFPPNSHHAYKEKNMKSSKYETKDVILINNNFKDLCSAIHSLTKTLGQDNFRVISGKPEIAAERTITRRTRGKKKIKGGRQTSIRTIEAEALINQAIDKIIEYNEQDNLAHKDKIRVGVGKLKDLTHRAAKVIRRVLSKRENELDEHHKKHELSAAHNMKGRYTTPIDKIIHLEIPEIMSNQSNKPQQKQELMKR